MTSSSLLLGGVLLAILCTPTSSSHLSQCPHPSDLWCLATFAGIPRSCQSHGDTLYCRAAATWLGANEQPHKPLVPVLQQDIVGMLLAAAALFFAAGGGLGGGGLLIPIYLTVMQFPTRGAVALSNVTIVGGALGNLLLNIGRRHPLRPGPLIDWDIILVMEPATILGALAGTYANKLLASWITTSLLSIVMGYMTYTLLKKGVKGWVLESARAAHAQPPGGVAAPLLAGQDVSTAPSEQPPLHSSEAADKDEEGVFGRMLDDEKSSGSDDQIQQELEVGPLVHDIRRLSRAWSVQRQQQLPIPKIAVLLALFFGVAATEIVKGGQPCGSWRYWLAVAAVLLPTLPVMVGSRAHLLRKHRERVASHALWAEGDVKWDERSTVIYPAVSTLAGVFAGLFGIGGGIVKGPLMLEMGVLPDVAAATSATMILMTSASACLVYFTFGTLQYDYAAVLSCVGFFATLAGQLTVYKLVKVLGRRSVIVFAMALFTVLSSVVVGWQAARLTAAAARAHDLWHWGSICG